ncbi:hypothetical protein OG730_03715 [Streptomyces sp. NBC_01298]|uniref:hypothetical protein n=1 Tax=Streptomyces sp. NBC_01298 TaxID=2903817 RepID=UPI002E131FBA|nr:hypothetical protein OG730_03715 [Streptomyces sp. NBC_01298]
MLTNEPALWTAPGSGRQPTRDHEFRIHAGGEAAGTLRWANGTYQKNTCTLEGTYRLAWDPYSEQDGPGGEFRYLAVLVSPTAGDARAL